MGKKDGMIMLIEEVKAFSKLNNHSYFLKKENIRKKALNKVKRKGNCINLVNSNLQNLVLYSRMVKGLALTS